MPLLTLLILLGIVASGVHLIILEPIQAVSHLLHVSHLLAWSLLFFASWCLGR